MTTDQKVQINPNFKFINVIGCGFAGIETALFLAGHGLKVHVFNALKKDCKKEDFIEEETFFDNLILKELSFLGSPLAREKEKNGLTYEQLIEFGQNMVKDNENIEFFDAAISEFNPREINIIATGNNTSKSMFGFLRDRFGSMRFLEYMPSYPIVDNVGELLLVKSTCKNNEYIYPLTEREYLIFINRVVDEINRIRTHDKDKEFERNTIEYLVDKGRDCLKNHAFQPVAFEGISTKPYASIRLRKVENGFEIQNFASNLPKLSQNRIICSLIPFKNAIIAKEACIKNGSFLNGKYVVNKFGQSLKEENLFFTGAILGLQRNSECMASGLITGMNVLKFVHERRMIPLPSKTALGKVSATFICEEGISILKKVENCFQKDKLEEYNNASKTELVKFKEEYINGKHV